MNGTNTDSGAAAPSAAPSPPPFFGSQLAKALAALQADLPRIVKDQTAKVETQKGPGFSYSYADLTAVTEAIMPKLANHGLAFTAFPTLREDDKFVLRYTLLHSSGEEKTGDYPLPISGNAQAVGSAITYARRYCLCAVTGVSPDDDDDAAAAVSQRDNQMSAEMQEATDSVRGAWVAHFGALDWVAARRLFNTWSKGEGLGDAGPATLRRFAAYLSALPAADAGQDPSEISDPKPPVSDDMSDTQRRRLFALFNKKGFKERADQVAFISGTLEREIDSRGDLTAAEADRLIEALKALGDEGGR